jgi:hypothetical protein
MSDCLNSLILFYSYIIQCDAKIWGWSIWSNFLCESLSRLKKIHFGMIINCIYTYLGNTPSSCKYILSVTSSILLLGACMCAMKGYIQCFSYFEEWKLNRIFLFQTWVLVWSSHLGKAGSIIVVHNFYPRTHFQWKGIMCPRVCYSRCGWVCLHHV